jgi:hypothetical protein
MPGVYQVGESITLAVVIRNPSTGLVFDPTTVVAKTLRPGDTSSTSASVTKDSTGNYHATVVPDIAGRWYYRWTTTGPADAREETFAVIAAHAT